MSKHTHFAQSVCLRAFIESLKNFGYTYVLDYWNLSMRLKKLDAENIFCGKLAGFETECTISRDYNW